MKKEVLDWLLGGPAWLKTAVEAQLLDLRPKRELALQDDSIVKIVERLKDDKAGFPAVKSGRLSYKSSSSQGNAYWDLMFLADIGLTANDLNLNEDIEDILKLQSADGTFVTWKEMKPGYFCISSILLSAIAGMSDKHDLRIRKFLDVVLKAQRLDGGWHCALSRGVGKKLQNTESCPMDNLNILMLLGRYPEYRQDGRFNGAIDLLLGHWEKRDEKWRPYGFGIGSQFKKLQYPSVKYGILRVLDVLSLFPYALKNKTFKNMFDFAWGKSPDGRYSAESVVKMYDGLDFGQKKEPSRWVTFLVHRIKKRIGDVPKRDAIS